MTGEAWQGREYATTAGHHRAVDAWFLDRHRPGPADRIVDAGSGSGEFTASLARMVPQGRVVGVEPDPSMLAAARERQQQDNLEFRQGRVQDLDVVCEHHWADLVISRAVFHWIPLAEYPRCYEAVRTVLRPGGHFHAESGGAGNVAVVVDVLDEVAARHGLPPAAVTFPDAGVVLELLERAGFDVPAGGVVTVAQRRQFDREGLVGFLRTQAVLAYVGGASAELKAAFAADVEGRLDDFRRHDGSYDQTFVRLDVLCRRSG